MNTDDRGEIEAKLWFVEEELENLRDDYNYQACPEFRAGLIWVISEIESLRRSIP